MPSEYEGDIDLDEEDAYEERNAVEEISSILRLLIPDGWGSYAWSLELINSGGEGDPVIDKIYDNATITCIFSRGIEEFQYNMGIAAKVGNLKKMVISDTMDYDLGKVFEGRNKSHVFHTAR
jgi:hypothetical protein